MCSRDAVAEQQQKVAGNRIVVMKILSRDYRERVSGEKRKDEDKDAKRFCFLLLFKGCSVLLMSCG